jgi:hypothetical protein
MKKIFALGLIITGPLIMFGFGCSKTTARPTPSSSAPIVLSYPEDPSPVRPRPSHEICDTKNFICVSETLVNKVFAGTASATGTAIAFENQFAWEILNASGTALFSGSLMANAPDMGQPGPFTLTATTPVASPTSATLRFYESSPKDGTPTHLLDIPVTLN